MRRMSTNGRGSFTHSNPGMFRPALALFSLLSFLHIGFPLGLLALLWIHKQRVPGARTNPPRRIMAWLLASLVVLSLFKPAVSQGTAALATAPSSLALDWFYLPIFPLFYKWSVRDVWLLVGGAISLRRQGARWPVVVGFGLLGAIAAAAGVLWMVNEP